MSPDHDNTDIKKYFFFFYTYLYMSVFLGQHGFLLTTVTQGYESNLQVLRQLVMSTSTSDTDNYMLFLPNSGFSIEVAYFDLCKHFPQNIGVTAKGWFSKCAAKLRKIWSETPSSFRSCFYVNVAL